MDTIIETKETKNAYIPFCIILITEPPDLRFEEFSSDWDSAFLHSANIEPAIEINWKCHVGNSQSAIFIHV